jgi:hypothetical protein
MGGCSRSRKIGCGFRAIYESIEGLGSLKMNRISRMDEERHTAIYAEKT